MSTSSYLREDLLDTDEDEAEYPQPRKHSRPLTPSASTRRRTGNGSTHAAKLSTAGTSAGERRYVLALDFGTTFTGVAYASVESQATHYSSSSRIEVLRNWGSKMGNMDKVPSVMAYTYGSPGAPEWGSDIHEDALTLVNQKLELELQENTEDELGLTLYVLNGTKGLSFDYIQQASEKPDFPCSTPEEIVTDYLRQIFECTRGAIRTEELRRTSTPVDLVITMPVEWSYEARNAVFRAATKAGFSLKGIPSLRDTILVTEPEAAAYYTARESGPRLLKENKCFVLCDAGGGTIDAVAFRVKQLCPYLQLEKVTSPTGRKCGSALIDTEFKRWLRKAIGEQNYKILDPAAAPEGTISPHDMESGAMRTLIKSFFAAKSTFSNNRKNAFTIELPKPLDRLTKRGRVDEGALIIQWKEMKKLMDKCVNPTIALILAQIQGVESLRGTEVKTIFLVGGFGASPYLQEELRKNFDFMGVKLFHPSKDSLTAVVQGAVIHGIERPQEEQTVRMTSMTKTYGYVHRGDQIRWFIKKGDLIMRGETTFATWETDDFWIERPSSEHSAVTFRLFRYDMDDDSEGDQRLPINWGKSWNDIQVAGIVRRTLRQLSRGSVTSAKRFRLLGPFKWRVTCNDSELFAELLLNGKELEACHRIATVSLESNRRPLGGPYGEFKAKPDTS